MELSYVPMYTRAAPTTGRSVDAVLSSETIDGHGEIVDQSTWRLERFKKNPVVLYMHSPYEVVGHAEQIRIVDGELVAKIVFATTPTANEVLQLFRDGAMRAFSVGFRVGRVEQQMVDGRAVRRLLDCELMEVSAVSIPSNPDAVVRHKSLGLLPQSYSYDHAADLVSLASARAFRPSDAHEKIKDSVASLFAGYGDPEIEQRSVEQESEPDPSADLVRIVSDRVGYVPGGEAA